MKVEAIAKKILAFDPGDDASFVAVGINEPLAQSATGLTWQDVRSLAQAAAPNMKIPTKKLSSEARVKLIPA
jgi:hypothetical protein